MAAIDYTIPGQIKGIQLESPMNAMAQAMQLRGLQEASQMNALKMQEQALKFQEAQRDAQERNALAKLDPSKPEYLTQLKRVNPKLALEYEKSGFEAESAKIKKQKDEADLVQAKLKESRYFLEGFNVNSPTAPADYIAWSEKNINDPVLGPLLRARGVTLDKVRKNVTEAIQTGTFEDLVNQSKLGVDRFTELTPAFRKAEDERINQEYSDYLNSLKPGATALTRLQFVELRKRQRPVAPAPDAAAPDAVAPAAAPAPAPAPAPAAAVDLTNVPLAERSIMFNRPQVNQLGGGQTTTAAVNNLGFMPAATITANRAAPATATTQAAGAKDRPLIHPTAAILYNSTLPGDRARADAIQRQHEADLKNTEKQRDFAAAQDAGFKGSFPDWLDQQRETESEREYRRAKNDGSFKGTFLDFKREMAKATKIVVQPAPMTLTRDALDLAADQFLVTGTIPSVNRADRSAIINRAAAMAKEKGMSADVVDRMANKANQSALTQLTKQETMVGAFEKNFIKNVSIVERISQKKDNTGVPLLQKWINVGKKAASGDPELASLAVAIKAVQNEYGKIVSGSMGNTAVAVSEIKRMEELLNAAQTPQDVMAVLNTMREETQNRMAGFKEQKSELTNEIRRPTKGNATTADPLGIRK